MCIARKGVVDQNSVVFGGIQLPVSLISDLHGSKNHATIERNRVKPYTLSLNNHWQRELSSYQCLSVPRHGMRNQDRQRTQRTGSDSPPTNRSLRLRRAPCFNSSYTTPKESILNTAILALEDGTVFEGRSFGAPAERSGEVVFNTALTGYQEVFTDPSYSGQIVILTNPQIGNYGTNAERQRVRASPYIEGLVVREFSPIASNWRSRCRRRTLSRARTASPSSATSTPARWSATCAPAASCAACSPSIERDADEAGREGARHSHHGRPRSGQPRLHARSATSGPRPSTPCSPSDHRRPRRRARASTSWPTISASSTTSCAAWCTPAAASPWCPPLTSAEDVLALKPDGIFLSNGPGDPEPLEHSGRATSAS